MIFYTYKNFLNDILHQSNLDGGEARSIVIPQLTDKKFVKFAKRLCLDYYTYLGLEYTDTHRYRYIQDKRLIFIESHDPDNNTTYATTMLYQVVGHIRQAKHEVGVKYLQAAIPALAFMISILTMLWHGLATIK